MSALSNLNALTKHDGREGGHAAIYLDLNLKTYPESEKAVIFYKFRIRYHLKNVNRTMFL